MTKNNIDRAIDSLIYELENNKSANSALIQRIKDNRKELKRYWYYTKIMDNPSISPKYDNMNKENIKNAIKEDKQTLKSVKKDNKLIRKEIKGLRKGL